MLNKVSNGRERERIHDLTEFQHDRQFGVVEVCVDRLARGERVDQPQSTNTGGRLFDRFRHLVCCNLLSFEEADRVIAQQRKLIGVGKGLWSQTVGGRETTQLVACVGLDDGSGIVGDPFALHRKDDSNGLGVVFRNLVQSGQSELDQVIRT